METVNLHEIKELENGIVIEAFSSGLTIGSAFWLLRFENNTICCMMNLVFFFFVFFFNREPYQDIGILYFLICKASKI